MTTPRGLREGPFHFRTRRFDDVTPETPRWARWRTALAVGAVTCVGAVGLGTTFVVADTGASTSASGSPTPTMTANIASSSAAPSLTARSAEQVTLDPRPSPKHKKAKPHQAHGKHTKKDGSLLSDVQDLINATPTTVPAAVFKVASFNVLGASHTGRHGNKPGFRTYGARMAGAVGLLRAFDVDVVGFQEFEAPQLAAFNHRTGGRYGVYPALRLGRNSVRNSIAWRQSEWRLVSANSISIPYFHGHRVRMPYILLQHIASGRKVWFINIHNPATTPRHGNNQRWRTMGTNLEIALVNRLHAQTGYPVIMTGDFNERGEAFCPVTSRTPMHAAAGGSTGGRCIPPGDARIDWIFGTPEIAFANYGFRHSRASDHPIVVSQATIQD